MRTAEQLIVVANNLSEDAQYIMCLTYFGTVSQWQAILAVPVNEAQEKAYEELLTCGFVHLDTERGQVGYRSSYDGREARDLYIQSENNKMLG